MSLDKILPMLTVLVALGLIVGIMYRQMLVVPRRKARLAVEKARDSFNAELARAGALPLLNTQWLMRVPQKFIGENPIRRSYGTRYNRILIIDEFGGGWVGLVTPEIVESLTAGEYVWRDYYIPFRGASEAYTGKPVDVAILEGLVHVDTYPTWMSEGVNLPDWTIWARIEMNFQNRTLNWNYQAGLGELNKHMEEFREKRENFRKLAAEAKMEVSQ